jgi:DNA polymerase III sliding clamp (beta) subunit (PCNA family)
MQLAVARSALLGPLSFVAAAADARSPTPILSHVLLKPIFYSFARY